jgi:primosomal protein N' (replication factor Y) (superfamily II helicase)
MHAYVEVAINLPQISDTYHYHLPPDLAGSVLPGSLVIVPFGNQRAQGVVLRYIDDPEVAKTRPVEDLVEGLPALTQLQLALAQWLADETLAPLGTCINLMLPPGLSQRTDTLVRLNTDLKIDLAEYSPLEKRIIQLLQARGDLRGRQIDAAIRHVEWRGVVRALARKGILRTRAILPEPRVSPKTVRKVALVGDPASMDRLEVPLSRVEKVHERRLRVLQVLAKESGLVETGWIYAQTGANNSDLKALEKAGWVEFINAQVWRDPLEDMSFVPAEAPELTQDQERAWEKIHAGLVHAQKGRAHPPFLLHGVTGSGKTELYLRAVGEALAGGKGAIIMVPEISLTPQTIQRFSSRFPGKVGVIHSQLSEGERYDTWRRVRKGELQVIVGPRSALFVPLENIGLIVVDECHQESYDQQDTLPYYRGVAAAVACARLAGGTIILGSATPQVTQFYQAVNGNWAYIELPKRILAHREAIARHASRLGIDLPVKLGEGHTADLGLPQVAIVDMRTELKAGNRSIFSREMQTAIEQVLAANQQAILFLNRRGTATYVFCRECGYVVMCPQDDKPLTYHRTMDRLLCHTCGYQRQVPKRCPQCGGAQIRQLGTGTEKVEHMVRERFPGARTLRWDAETTRKKGAHERILTQFTHHAADILIGTQMLAKGLDLPLVTLVGVVLAEVGLNLPDYRAAERTFQVLTQVAGRAGRSPLGGRVVLQTYVPDHYAIQTAAQHDYETFFAQEMNYRRQLRYPPFSQLVRLEYRHHDPQVAEEAAVTLAGHLQEWIADEGRAVDLIGPVPCFFTRMYGRYRWQIILRGRDPAELLRDRQPPDWVIEVDPPSLL